MSESATSQFGGTLAVVLAGAALLLIVGMITRARALRVIAAVVLIGLLFPFLLLMIPKLDATVLIIAGIMFAIWMVGMLFGMVGGEHARGIAVAEMMMALLSLPFRMLSALYRLLAGRKSK